MVVEVGLVTTVVMVTTVSGFVVTVLLGLVLPLKVVELLVTSGVTGGVVEASGVVVVVTIVTVVVF